MNNKKFSDIYPPKKFERIKVQKPKRLRVEMDAPEKKPFFLPLKKRLFVSLLPFFILIALLAYFGLSKAEIEIWPETQTLNFEEKVSANLRAEEKNIASWVENKFVPVKMIEEEKNISQQIFSSGKVLKEVKAKGLIRVYNAYSTSSQVLVARTRFISSEGKLFRSLSRITVPGAEYEKGKLQPRYIEAEVEAAEPGDDYNIGPSTFSIPGFAGTEKYTAFYGKSFESMTGGFRGEISQVTQKDLDGAKEVLMQKALEEARDSLEMKLDSDFIFLDDALKMEMAEADSLVKAGTETESFIFQIKAKIRALLFRKSDLEKLAKEILSSRAPQDMILQEESFDLKYSLEKVDFDSKEITLKIDFSGKVYENINISTFREVLGGKSLKETQLIFEEQANISKFKVKLWPFWVQKVPQNINKIEIKLRID